MYNLYIIISIYRNSVIIVFFPSILYGIENFDMEFFALK